MMNKSYLIVILDKMSPSVTSLMLELSYYILQNIVTHYIHIC